MSTTRIKEKISSIVLSQLPEFIQSDYPTFVSFLEAYYEFIEQDQNAHELIQNIRSYNDIDRTIDSFIEYFLKQYCNDIPRDVLYNKKALVKNIKNLYNNKGNEKSYRLLFNILYNKEINLSYPYNQILRASDGKWNQSNTFFMRTIAGDESDIIYKEAIISSTSTKYRIKLKKRRSAYSSSGASTDIFEYFYDTSSTVPINIGDIVENDNFRGVVVPTVSSAVILDGGAGFSVGDVLTPTSGTTGNTARILVTKVNSESGILAVTFLLYGIGYSSNFYNTFYPTLNLPTTYGFTFSAGSATITDYISGFNEKGVIVGDEYAESTYFANDYAGTILRDFASDLPSEQIQTYVQKDNFVSALITPRPATISFIIGAKAKYPGYFEEVNGFLSDNIYLENIEYYQPYSYVVSVDEQLSSYKKAILDILHPAGTKLLGDLSLTTNIDLDVSVQ